MTHIICIAHGLGDGIVTVYIDNREAGKRGTATEDYINIGDYLRADHDISLLLQHLINASPVTIDYAWVKSHQDELPTGELIHGPFLRPVQLNQYVDTLAGKGRDDAKIASFPSQFSLQPFYKYTPQPALPLMTGDTTLLTSSTELRCAITTSLGEDGHIPNWAWSIGKLYLSCLMPRHTPNA